MVERITIFADLETNIVMPTHRWPLCLDGIAAFASMRASMGNTFGTGEITDESVEETDRLQLPFTKMGSGENWFWAASRAYLSEESKSVEWIHSRNDLLKYEKTVPLEDRENVDEKNVKWKNVRLPQVSDSARRVFWFADSTNPDELIDLLSTVPAIGKNWSRGNGQVTKWSYETRDTDFDPGWRPMIVDTGGVLEGIRPPYWHPKQKRMVA